MGRKSSGLKPQDLLVLLKLALHRKQQWTYASLAVALAMSPSEVHAAVGRARQLGLLRDEWSPNRDRLLEFLMHGARYVFPAEHGAVTRGIPTAHAAPPLSDYL